MAQDDTDHVATALFSGGVLLRILAFAALLAAAAAGLSVAGRYYGSDLSIDGNTRSRDIHTIAIGQDVVSLGANMIRFENQRHSGKADSVSLYLSWPALDGYTDETAWQFADPTGSRSLIFVEFSQSVMSRDMSGRLEPIYSKLFRGQAETGPAGLSLHRLDPKSGFGDEVVLTATGSNGAIYVVRCLLPQSAAQSTAADCQRDIKVGRDLTMLYRFSSTLLDQWRDIDDRLTAFADQRLRK